MVDVAGVQNARLVTSRPVPMHHNEFQMKRSLFFCAIVVHARRDSDRRPAPVLLVQTISAASRATGSNIDKLCSVSI